MDNLKVALILFGHEPASTKLFKTSEQRLADKIRNEEDDRTMTIAFRALELIGEPQTLSDWMLALEILPFAGVCGSKTTIRYITKWINKEYIDDSQNPKFRPNTEDLNTYYGLKLSQLGKAYEHTYELENAVIAYKKAFECFVNNHSICVISNIVRCLNRLGKFDDAINFLEDIKKTATYTSKYCLNQWGEKEGNYWILIIDESLEDTKKKKEKNMCIALDHKNHRLILRKNTLIVIKTNNSPHPLSV